jgi:hypothetical protein
MHTLQLTYISVWEVTLNGCEVDYEDFQDAHLGLDLCEFKLSRDTRQTEQEKLLSD